MEPIITSTAKGIDQLIGLSPIIALLIIMSVVGFVVAKRILEQCEKREERSANMWLEASNAHNKSNAEHAQRTLEMQKETAQAVNAMALQVAVLSEKVNRT